MPTADPWNQKRWRALLENLQAIQQLRLSAKELVQKRKHHQKLILQRTTAHIANQIKRIAPFLATHKQLKAPTCNQLSKFARYSKTRTTRAMLFVRSQKDFPTGCLDIDFSFLHRYSEPPQQVNAASDQCRSAALKLENVASSFVGLSCTNLENMATSIQFLP